MDAPNNNTTSDNNSSPTPLAPIVKPEHHTLMAVLAYIGPLVIISYIFAKDNAFVKFHIKQGLVLFVINILIWVLSDMFYWHMYSLFKLINLATLVLAVIGIINALQKKEKQLPLVGGLASYFTF